MEVECIKSKNPNLRLGEQGTNEQGLNYKTKAKSFLFVTLLSGWFQLISKLLLGKKKNNNNSRVQASS